MTSSRSAAVLAAAKPWQIKRCLGRLEHTFWASRKSRPFRISLVGNLLNRFGRISVEDAALNLKMSMIWYAVVNTIANIVHSHIVKLYARGE